LLGVPVTIVENRELIQVLSQLGVIFLLFFLGL
jgi:Kef-type K+ transport system membrane component KefB